MHTDPERTAVLRALGRGVIVDPGTPAPGGWDGAPRVAIDDAALRAPASLAGELHQLWATRTPAVVEVGVEVEALRAPETDDRAPYLLDPAFEFARERLYFLARANSYDARSGRAAWGPAIEAGRLGASPGGPADVVLPDGTPAWCDGGPRAGQVAIPTGHALVHRVRIEEGALAPDRLGVPATAPLAPDQLAAVSHDAGPARIIAPAGSGKTRVLTERMRLLVAARGWGGASLTAVAYNVRAADEMRGRLADLPQAGLRNVRTLHSLGHAILREHHGTIDVLDERAVRSVLQDIVAVKPRANTDVLAPYLEALGRVRLGLVTPETVEAERDDVPGFAQVFAVYRDTLRRAGAVDHDEQIYGAVEVLLRDVATRRRFQRACRHLLVDELQDLTPAQLLLVRLLAAPAYDVFGVGDDDQVIYGYAGADPDFLIRYDTYFPGARHHDLEVNYRCPPAIVVAASTLLQHNARRVPKTIRAAKPEAAPDALTVEAAAADVLAHRALAAITAWIDEGASPSSIAVLARVNAALLPIQVLLRDATVPCWTAVTRSVLERTGVRAALAYLRLAAAVAGDARLDGRDLAIALRRPPRSLPRPLLLRIERRKWTMDALVAAGNELPSRAADRFDEFVTQIRAIGAAASSGATTADLLVAVRDTVGLGGALETLDLSGRGPDGSHADDLNALIAVAALEPEPRAFEGWLRERLPVALDREPPPGALAISTVHRVKGMEWPRVVVLGAHDGSMPHALAEDVEEERRIFHVAITRASERALVLVASGKPAPFVREMREPPGPGTETTPARRVRRPDTGAGAAPRPGPPPAGSADRTLVDALKAWRRGRSQADGHPAYVVLKDSDIEGIAERAPATLRDLAYCPGIGPTKLERYGDDILAVIDEWRAARGDA